MTTWLGSVSSLWGRHCILYTILHAGSLWLAPDTSGPNACATQAYFFQWFQSLHWESDKLCVGRDRFRISEDSINQVLSDFVSPLARSWNSHMKYHQQPDTIRVLQFLIIPFQNSPNSKNEGLFIYLFIGLAHLAAKPALIWTSLVPKPDLMDKRLFIGFISPTWALHKD